MFCTPLSPRSTVEPGALAEQTSPHADHGYLNSLHKGSSAAPKLAQSMQALNLYDSVRQPKLPSITPTTTHTRHQSALDRLAVALNQKSTATDSSVKVLTPARVDISMPSHLSKCGAPVSDKVIHIAKHSLTMAAFVTNIAKNFSINENSLANLATHFTTKNELATYLVEHFGRALNKG